MTDNKDDKFKVIEFNPKEDNSVTPEMIEKLELIVQKAKAGKLVSIVLFTEYEPEEDSEDDFAGGLMLWNSTGNPKEFVADTAALHAVALGGMLGGTEIE